MLGCGGESARPVRVRRGAVDLCSRPFPQTMGEQILPFLSLQRRPVPTPELRHLISRLRNVKGLDERPFHIIRFDPYSNVRNRQFEPLGFAPWVVFAFDAWPISRSYFWPVKKTSVSDWLPSVPGLTI